MNAQIIDTPAGKRIHVPMNLVRRSGRKRIIIPDTPDVATQEITRQQPAGYHDALVIAIARAFRWKRLLDEGRYSSIAEMATALGMSRYYLARVLRLTLLSPEIIEAIVDGRESDGLSIERLRCALPSLWKDQTKMFGTRCERTRS